MTDIQIIDAIHDGPYIRVQRTLDGLGDGNRMPREILAIRAAEYNLFPDDPFVLDLVLLERFYVPDNPDEVHPLFAAPTVADALSIMMDRIGQVRNEHGADAQFATMTHAIWHDAATEGCAVAQHLLLTHADPEVAEPVQFFRDRGRHDMRSEPMTLTEKMVLRATQLGMR